MSTKVDSEAYVNLLNDSLLPDCDELYPAADFTFMQDGATSHTSHSQLPFLRIKTLISSRKMSSLPTRRIWIRWIMRYGTSSETLFTKEERNHILSMSWETRFKKNGMHCQWSGSDQPLQPGKDDTVMLLLRMAAASSTCGFKKAAVPSTSGIDCKFVFIKGINMFFIILKSFLCYKNHFVLFA